MDECERLYFKKGGTVQYILNVSKEIRAQTQQGADIGTPPQETRPRLLQSVPMA